MKENVNIALLQDNYIRLIVIKMCKSCRLALIHPRNYKFSLKMTRSSTDLGFLS